MGMDFYNVENVFEQKVIKRKFLPENWKESPYNKDLVGLGALYDFLIYSFSKRMFAK